MSLEEYIAKRTAAYPAFVEGVRLAQAELDLAILLANCREELGLTQAQLARRMGMQQPNLARLERAGRAPSLETVWRFADALGVTITFGPGFSVAIRRADAATAEASALSSDVCASAVTPRGPLSWPDDAAGRGRIRRRRG